MPTWLNFGWDGLEEPKCIHHTLTQKSNLTLVRAESPLQKQHSLDQPMNAW